MSDDLTPEEVVDGLALWEEHRPRSGEDWIAVAHRFVADHSKSSPLFAALAMQTAEVERLRRELDLSVRERNAVVRYWMTEVERLRAAMSDVRQDVIDAARMLADSFTAPDGSFIHDDLTETEWRVLRDALDRLDGKERRRDDDGR